MRVSVIEGDPGYKKWAVLCRVLLDGEEVSHCFTADKEKGEVYCYVTDKNGRMVLDHENPRNVKTVVKRGKVLIVLPEDFAMAYGRENVEEDTKK